MPISSSTTNHETQRRQRCYHPPLSTELLAHIDGGSTHEGLLFVDYVSRLLVKHDIGLKGSARQEANLATSSRGGLALGMRQQLPTQTLALAIRMNSNILDPEMIRTQHRFNQRDHCAIDD